MVELERKPEPETKQSFQVTVAEGKQAVKLNTKISDKRQQKLFDRSAFESRMAERGLPVPPPQPKKKVAPGRPKPLRLPVQGVQAVQPEQAVQEEEPPPELQVKKKVGKIKLKTNMTGTITGLASTADRARRTKPPKFGEVSLGPTQVTVSDADLTARLPPKAKPLELPMSTFYMNNRSIFISFIDRLFEPYKEQLKAESANITCSNRGGDDISLLTHQQIIRDYLNLYTPYRGLLLYHGLGAGKTCGSIAIAEGFKESRQILVMTPASLRMNYIEEIKKCGDVLYKKNQFWEFVETDDVEVIDRLAKALNLAPRYVQKQKGAWVADIKKPSNFMAMSQDEKTSLDRQLNEMIANKYQFVNYNGLQERHMAMLTSDYTTNPFSNRVVVIDEAHNFISRIVNKLKRKDPSLAVRLYQYLMEAEDCRIVLLSGTPMINYPNELAVLFNILRGKITTWTVKLQVKSKRKVDQKSLEGILKEMKTLDYMNYQPSTGLMTITRNPDGFINKFSSAESGKRYAGVQRKPSESEATNDAFFAKLTKVLKKEDISIATSVTTNQYEALPDMLDDFLALFVDDKTSAIKNKLMFQKRIIGLTSYFRSAQEQLMPRYNPDDGDYKIVYIDMSDFQFGVYESARVQERKLEVKNARRRKASSGTGDLYDDAVSTYRIFSRAFCNFVFPREIGRPMPTKSGEVGDELIDEDAIAETARQDVAFAEETEPALSSLEAVPGPEGEITDASYEARIQDALAKLKEQGGEFLTPKGLETYSPKFLNVLENVMDREMVGLHLIYTQFRTLEGIGILKLIFEQNGMMHFKISKAADGQWFIDVPEEILARRLPGFILYTGTETPEEKEILRNIFNSNWDYVPPTIVAELTKLSKNNFYGQIIKVIMITAAGAEGITLKNVRYVHLVEPYWHPVRTEQVIGRARRICSHEDLDPEYRTVQVMLYLMKFSQSQLDSDESIELRLHDKSKFDQTTPVTSDQTLYEISKQKQTIATELMNAVKETSIDCSVHDLNKNEGLKCLTLGSSSLTSYSFQPSISGEEKDTVSKLNQQTIQWKAKELTQGDKKYALRPDTDELYTYESYVEALRNPGVKPKLLGVVTRNEAGKITGVRAP
jgi:hypothetical protein